MSRLNFNLHEWEKEKIDALDRMESKRIDMEEGMKLGIEQTTKDTIISMSKNDATLEFISKVTGKSIEEIEKIIKENN